MVLARKVLSDFRYVRIGQILILVTANLCVHLEYNFKIIFMNSIFWFVTSPLLLNEEEEIKKKREKKFQELSKIWTKKKIPARVRMVVKFAVFFFIL